MPQTKNLKLCVARRADVPDLFSFLGDASAMAFTHVDHSLQDCRRRVMAHEYFRRRDGCAPWVVRESDTNRIIGWGGLYQDPFEPGWGFEVGPRRGSLPISPLRPCVSDRRPAAGRAAPALLCPSDDTRSSKVKSRDGFATGGTGRSATTCRTALRHRTKIGLRPIRGRPL